MNNNIDLLVLQDLDSSLVVLRLLGFIVGSE